MLKKEKTILIIEDEGPLLKILSRKFEEMDFKVFTATNGQSGLKNAKDSHPSIILLDLVMPIMDGIEMLKKLRDSEWGKNIPVIVLTNLNTKKEIIKAIDKNIDYLVKADWKLNEIINKVEKKIK